MDNLKTNAPRAAGTAAAMAPGVEPRVHQWRIDPYEYRRQEQRRGRRHAFTHVDPKRTALLVIDMVPFFDGVYFRGVVPQINGIAAALRGAGGTVVWVLPGQGRPLPVREEFYGAAVAEIFRTSGGTGPLVGRLWPDLAVDEQHDVLMEKLNTSALFPGSSDLPGLLRLRDVTTVVLCGTVTGVCVESTARDAAQMGYRVVQVADGCAGGTDDAHNASLRVVYRSFGDVRTTAEVIEMVEHPGETA